MGEVVIEIINEVQLVLISVCCLLVIIMIFLNYRWKLDILHELDKYFSKINDKYSNDRQNRLSSIADEVQKFSREWNKTQSDSEESYQEEGPDDLSDALDDMFGRYG